MTKFYLEFEKPLKVIDEKIISFSSMPDLNKEAIANGRNNNCFRRTHAECTVS